MRLARHPPVAEVVAPRRVDRKANAIVSGGRASQPLSLCHRAAPPGSTAGLSSKLRASTTKVGRVWRIGGASIGLARDSSRCLGNATVDVANLSLRHEVGRVVFGLSSAARQLVQGFGAMSKRSSFGVVVIVVAAGVIGLAVYGGSASLKGIAPPVTTGSAPRRLVLCGLGSLSSRISRPTRGDVLKSPRGGHGRTWSIDPVKR